jgi:uncharacterized membrane protein YhhN
MEMLYLGLFAVAAVVDWIAVARGNKVLEYVAKPATLAFLALFANSLAGASHALIAALLFSLLGDVYLMLPADLFLAGLGAFLFGHVAYVAAFDVPLLSRLLWFVVAAILSSPLALRILRAVDDSALRVAVACYMAVITLMVASAIASGSPPAIAGSLLFFASDAMIAWNRFVQPFGWARVGIIVTYHLGQLGLVLGLIGAAP